MRTHGECCSRSAAPRRRLVGRVLFPAPTPEHEDLLGSQPNCLGTMRHLRRVLQLNVSPVFQAVFCLYMVLLVVTPKFGCRAALQRSMRLTMMRQLQVTASQTDTTRGVMISGIMGNAEEWIKEMENTLCPTAIT